jgi:hypothetical protein
MNAVARTFDVLKMNSSIYALCNLPSCILAYVTYHKALDVLKESKNEKTLTLIRKTVERLRLTVNAVQDDAPERFNDFEMNGRPVGLVDRVERLDLSIARHSIWRQEWATTLNNVDCTKPAYTTRRARRRYGQPSQCLKSIQNPITAMRTSSSQPSTSTACRHNPTASTSTASISTASISTASISTARTSSTCPMNRTSARRSVATLRRMAAAAHVRRSAKKQSAVTQQPTWSSRSETLNLDSTLNVYKVVNAVAYMYSRCNDANKISLRQFEREAPVMMDRMVHNLLTADNLATVRGLARSGHVPLHQIRGIMGTGGHRSCFSLYFLYDDQANTEINQVATLFFAVASCLVQDMLAHNYGERLTCCKAFFDGFIPRKFVRDLLSLQTISMCRMDLRTRNVPQQNLFPESSLSARFSQCRFLLPLLERGCVNKLVPRHGRHR